MNIRGLLALLLTSVLSAAAIAQQSELTATQITERLAEWDQAYARLKRDTWTLQRSTSMFGRDFRGRLLSDDLRDFALPKAKETRFTQQRALTVAQVTKGDLKLATETLLGLYRELRDELATLERIGEHRLRFRQVEQQRYQWRQLAATVPSYTPPDLLRQLEQQAVEQLNAGNFESTSRKTYPALLQAYAHERTELWKRGAKTSSAIIYARRSACTDAAKSTTGKESPSPVITTTPNYPAASRRAGEEGTVYLQLLASSSGCVQRYAIRLSSGWPDLDDASLDWVETLQFLPAEKDGKAVDAWVTMPVVFHLTD